MAVVALLTLNGRLAAQDSRPLPNQDAFVAEARTHLHSDRMLLSQYTYTDKQTRFERDSHGAVVKQTVKVFEVHTSVDDDLTYERLVSVDGIPVNRQALERSDHKQAQKEREQAAKLQVETPGDRSKRLEKAAELRRKEQAAIDEIFSCTASGCSAAKRSTDTRRSSSRSSRGRTTNLAQTKERS